MFRDAAYFRGPITRRISARLGPDYMVSFNHFNNYSPYGFSQQKSFFSSGSSFSLLHTNVGSLRRNLDNFQSHLLEELQLHFSVIGVTEAKITNSNLPLDFNPSIPNYRFEFVPTPLSAGGLGMYIHNDPNYTAEYDLCRLHTSQSFSKTLLKTAEHTDIEKAFPVKSWQSLRCLVRKVFFAALKSLAKMPCRASTSSALKKRF